MTTSYRNCNVANCFTIAQSELRTFASNMFDSQTSRCVAVATYSLPASRRQTCCKWSTWRCRRCTWLICICVRVCVVRWLGCLGNELTKLRAIFANIREFIMNPLLKFYTTVCHNVENSCIWLTPLYRSYNAYLWHIIRTNAFQSTILLATLLTSLTYAALSRQTICPAKYLRNCFLLSSDLDQTQFEL